MNTNIVRRLQRLETEIGASKDASKRPPEIKIAFVGADGKYEERRLLGNGLGLGPVEREWIDPDIAARYKALQAADAEFEAQREPER